MVHTVEAPGTLPLSPLLGQCRHLGTVSVGYRCLQKTASVAGLTRLYSRPLIYRSKGWPSSLKVGNSVQPFSQQSSPGCG